MFLSKKHFVDALKFAEVYNSDYNEEENTLNVAVEYAKELFEEFDRMSEDDRQHVLRMIIDDISADKYCLN